MSRLTSIHIKINAEEHPATLLAEYGGDFEMKVWILEKSNAWTGELSSVEALKFISEHQRPREVFLEELRRALTMSENFWYSIDKNEDKGYALAWKKCLPSGNFTKCGQMTLEQVSREEVFHKVMEHNTKLQANIDLLLKEQEALRKDKEKILAAMEQMVLRKEAFEKDIYSRFLPVLNSKKERIRSLESELAYFRSIYGNGNGTNAPDDDET